MSAITFQYLRDRDLGWLSESATQWDTFAGSLQDVHDDMISNVAGVITRSSWRGAAATQAGEVCDETVVLLQSRQVRAAGIATILSRGYDDISGAQTRLRSAITAAEREHLKVGDDGTVTAGDNADAQDKQQISTFQEKLDTCLRDARTADDDTAAAVRDLAPAEPGYVATDEFRDISGDLRAHLKIPAPPTDGSPKDNATWWENLSQDEQNAYTYAYPEKVGLMDGLPSDDRHVANLITLRGDAAGGHDRQAAERLLDRIENSQYGPEDERMYLLGYEPPGADGNPDAKVIAAIGNPDTADHTGVLVPGTGADLGGIGGDLDRIDDLRVEAGMIPGSGKVSMIVWLGYDAPDTIPAAVLGTWATDGAPDLRSFTQGLEASHPGSPAHTTVIGHSYGSTVVGTADALSGEGLATDDIIAMGSPGMGYESPDRQGWFDGPKVDNVSDMHIDADHMWAGAAKDDVVTYTGVHGNSPVDWSFGGQRITTDGADGHSEYWDPGTEALRNQAYILTGEYDQVDFVGRRVG